MSTYNNLNSFTWILTTRRNNNGLREVSEKGLNPITKSVGLSLTIEWLILEPFCHWKRKVYAIHWTGS